MEVASLSIGIAGLAGLFSTCLDMVGRWDSYKDFVLESGSIKARFVADRVRFRQWGERVGLDQGKFKDDHHQTLDDPVVRSAVHLILHSIARIDDDVKNLSSYLGDLSHLSSSLPESSLALPSSHTLFEKLAPPRKKRIGWAMRGKTRTLVLVGSFETLVQKLYNLVPPEEQKSKVTAPIVEADSWRDDIQKILVDLEKQIQNETLREILDWLDAPDTRRTYDDCILRRLDGTCDWILHRPEFCRWQSSVSREQKILWIHGPPGYGKTIICARIVEYLSTKSCDNIAHFFFSSELEIRSNPFAVMRSWITQLLPRAQQAFDLIRDKWEATDGRTASKIDIKELFDTLIHNLPPCTFVVDGLDECAVADVAGGLDHQSSLFEFLRSLACTISQSKSRLLIVSRNEVRIREGLSVENDQTKREFVELPISPNDVKADASAFSASIVNRKLSNKSNMQREELASRLVDRCQSMFLAIKLLEDDLRGGKNLKQLQRAIDQAPQKLDNIYDRNWDRIQRLENSTRSRAFSILRWATFAVRPLTILELTECLLITGECDEIDYEELPDTVDDIYVKTEILEICGSLIEIRGEPSSILGHYTVHLAHFSVREYILYRMPFYGVDPIANEQLRSSSVGIQNNTLAMLCLHYLNCDQTWKEVELGQPGGTIIHAFRRYAANSWHLHVRREAANSGQTFQTINAFFRQPNPNWEQWRMECVDIFPEDWLSHNEREIEVGNRLFYASLLGLAETVEYLIEEVRLEIDNVDSSARTALIAASITGDRLCATQLLERGANVNFTSSGGATPLHSAAAYQHFDIAKLLLEKGADPCLRDSEGWTPLLVSSELGDVNTVKLLLNHAVGINFADKDGWTPLAIASSNGHTETVEILLNHATSIDFADKDGWTPLAISARNGHTETVKMLLDHAASIDLANKNGLTPLMVASRRGDTETVKILLGYAAGVNLASKTGLTPLVLASLHGHIDIVQILLAHGACVNANAWQGHTALTLAAERGSIDVVRLLLDYGVSIDTSDSYGRSVLSYAAESENTELVELLFQRGANPNSLDTLGRSPIFFATRSGNLAMVYLILSKTSVALESSDIYGSTILSIAVRHGHVDIVEHLLSRGDIDLTSKDIFGRSVASWANVPYVLQRITETAAKRGVPLELNDNNAPVHSPERGEVSRHQCDVCTLNIAEQRTYYHCSICANDDFDICGECFGIGAHCLENSHHLIAKVQ